MTDEPRRATPRRSRLDSPWLTLGLLGIVALLVGAIVALSALAGAPGPSATPAASPSQPTTSPGSSPSVIPTFSRPTPSPAPTFLSHVVQSGDSLNSIATRFHTTPRSIAWWNRGTYPSLDPESEGYDPNRIEVGWVLVLIPGVTVDDNNPPTPSPAPPTATPAPTSSTRPTSAPTATAAVPATAISHGTRGSGKVALTLDMGGRLDPAVAIVQWLIDHDVHATLFPTGKTGSTTTQGKAALQLAAQHPELFDLGNHSWDHPDFRTLTAAQMRDQLVRTEEAMAPLVGQSTKPWFRPPFGGWNDAVRAGVGSAGWRYLVLWDVDTIDWKPVADGGPTTQDIVTKVSTKAQGGSIVLMHLGGYNTLDALPGILTALEAKGLQPVTLGEMFGQ